MCYVVALVARLGIAIPHMIFNPAARARLGLIPRAILLRTSGITLPHLYILVVSYSSRVQLTIDQNTILLLRLRIGNEHHNFGNLIEK